MVADIPLTRQTAQALPRQSVQYSDMPARAAAQLLEGLIDTSKQIEKQAQAGYLLDLNNTMSKELTRIESENVGNPEGMEAAFNGMKEGFFDKINGSENRLLMEEKYQALSMPMIRRAMDVKRDRLDDEVKFKSLEAIDNAELGMIDAGPGLLSTDKGKQYDAVRAMQANLAAMSGSLNTTKADGRPMFSAEERMAAISQAKDRMIIGGVTKLADTNPHAAMKAWKNGKMEVTLYDEQGNPEKLNLRKEVSPEIAVKVDDYLQKKVDAADFKASVQKLQFSTPAERMAALSSGNEHLANAAKEVQNALMRDPAGYVVASPEVQRAAVVAKQAPTPENNAMYIDTSIAMQRKMGVPEYAVRVLPESQAAVIAGGINDNFANGQNVHESMMKLQTQYGAYWPRVSQELQTAKASPAAMVMGTMVYPTQAPAGKLLSEAVSEGQDAVFKAIGDDNKKDIMAALPGALDDFRESTQRMQGGTVLINQFTDASGLLAAKLMQKEGLSASAAVEKAVKTLVNDYYDFRGTYRIPAQRNGGHIAAQADRLKENLNVDLLYPGKNEHDKAAYESSVRAFGYWVNTPEDDGIVLKDSADNYVRAKDGKFIRYSFEELEKLKLPTPEDDSKLRNSNRTGIY